MYEPQFQFDWDEAKAVGNLHKHGISFELASSVFSDPRILTIANLEHSELEERWFSIGSANNGAMLSVAYLWKESESGQIETRLMTPRRATAREVRYYIES